MKMKIGPSEVQVNVYPGVLDEVDDELFGLFEEELSDRQIQLSDSDLITDRDFLDSLFHETFHAIDSVMRTQKTDHDIIQLYAACLAQALTSAGLVDAKAVRRKLRKARRR